MTQILVSSILLHYGTDLKDPDERFGNAGLSKVHPHHSPSMFSLQSTYCFGIGTLDQDGVQLGIYLSWVKNELDSESACCLHSLRCVSWSI